MGGHHCCGWRSRKGRKYPGAREIRDEGRNGLQERLHEAVILTEWRSGIICGESETTGGHCPRGGRVRTPKKKRTEFHGLCPFHAEKSPVICGASDKQIYHCFGCGVVAMSSSL